MATSTPHLCPYCGNLAQGTCPCITQKRARRAKARANYQPWANSTRKGSTRQWRQFRAAWLNDNPWCANCAAHGRWAPATQLDHIIPLAEAPERELDPSNVQSLCATCHTQKTKDDSRNGKLKAQKN